MNESTLFLISFILYFFSAFFYFAFLFSKSKKFAKQGYWIAAIGLVIHTLALVLRIFESGHAPFTNMYESLSFLGWSAVFAYVFVEAKFKLRRAGPSYMLIVIALMALASSPLMPKEATPLVPPKLMALAACLNHTYRRGFFLHCFCYKHNVSQNPIKGEKGGRFRARVDF